MFKSLRVPEKLFGLAMWVVSILFASFLIGLGGKIVGDLPGVQQYITSDQFLDSAQVRRINHTSDSLQRDRGDLNSAMERARVALTAQSNAYRSRRESFNNWIATRTATTNPQQDPEVIARTRELDGLNAAERAAQAEVDRLDAAILKDSQGLEALERERSTL